MGKGQACPLLGLQEMNEVLAAFLALLYLIFDLFILRYDLHCFMYQVFFLDAWDTTRNKMVKVSLFGELVILLKEVSKSHTHYTETPTVLYLGLGKR